MKDRESSPYTRAREARPNRSTAMPLPAKVAVTVTVSLIAIFLALVATKMFFIGYYHIPPGGRGMYPSLAPGDHFFTVRRAYSDVSRVKRGDIIVFVREENGQLYDYIWRVVGLPGDKVDAFGGDLSINGKPVQRQYVREDAGSAIFREQIGDATYEIAFDRTPRFVPPATSVTVPPDYLFVMGDNRFWATDSRSFGPIAFSSIIGRKF